MRWPDSFVMTHAELRMFKPSILLMAICMAAAATSGCSDSAPPDTVSAFLKKNPEEAKRYKSIRVTAVDLAKTVAIFDDVQLRGVATTIKNKFGNSPGATEYADLVLRVAERQQQSRFKLFEELEAAEAAGGVVCHYEWADGRTEQDGILVLRDGRVVKRLPWTTTHRDEQVDGPAGRTTSRPD